MSQSVGSGRESIRAPLVRGLKMVVLCGCFLSFAFTFSAMVIAYRVGPKQQVVWEYKYVWLEGSSIRFCGGAIYCSGKRLGFRYGNQSVSYSGRGFRPDQVKLTRAGHSPFLGLEPRKLYPEDKMLEKLGFYGQIMEHSFGFTIPSALFLAMTSVLPAMTLFRRIRSVHRRNSGLCVICGFNLKFSPDRCPECGSSIKNRGGN